MRAGIEAMNVFGGSAYLDVTELARHRNLDKARFENLLMKQKAVALPFEDPVTFAANAARPVVDSLSAAGKSRIELLITCSESGIDFGKSMSTYLHWYLGLDRNCRLFEVKQACYAGTAGLQMALSFILSQASPGAKALVVATDISRFFVSEEAEAMTQDWAFAEPSAGAGAVAMLVSAEPDVFQVDIGANGYYGYEVMDTCRPVPDGEAGNADLSLLSYLDCCENTYREYARRVDGADYATTFDYLTFHTPFGGMVKGAHRTMMRKLARSKPDEIERDFGKRVAPGITYCQRVGNIMGGTLYMALAGVIDRAELDSERRVGCFSYGSGCCSEFFSGVVTQSSQQRQRDFRITEHLDRRYRLSMDEYGSILRGQDAVRFGTRNLDMPEGDFAAAKTDGSGRARLCLTRVKDFHREYQWVQ